MASNAGAPFGEIAKMFTWSQGSRSQEKKRVFFLNEGSFEDRNLLGNKGANLCEMQRLGLPVPAAFLITTDTCLDYFHSERQLPEHFEEEYTKAVHQLEQKTGKSFGSCKDGKLPLLLSVRSGAAVSMPGMMDTVLNLGINDEVVDSLIRLTNNPRWAYDTYRRFLQMYGNVVLGVVGERYEEVLLTARQKRGVHHDCLLTHEDLVDVVKQFKEIAIVPMDPWEQLRSSIEAVFNSWYSPRAIKYRDINDIPNTLGTGVVVQSMVYGNMNDNSGSGVGFTRDPATGKNIIYGEYLRNAEGEDVVSGVRTPMTLEDLKTELPAIYEQLVHIMNILEKHYKDMQDIEFTVENKTLYMLQTRTGKRTARAAVTIAVDMVQERLITEREALMRIEPAQMNFFLHPMISPEHARLSDPAVAARVLGKGLAASAGAAVGVAAFSCAQAEAFSEAGTACILIRNETSADDIGGMKAAVGALTLHGGLTSHAAVVMRGMGKPTVTGLRAAVLDNKAKTLTSVPKNPDQQPLQIKEGDTITIDGSSGLVFLGEMPTVSSGQDENFATVMRWADKYKRLRVLANAETFKDVNNARNLGAEGVGLCRSEHMFFLPDRIDMFRQMILSDTKEERELHLAKLLPLQQKDFFDLYQAMHGNQVTVRLLDPPLHEFLPDPRSSDFDAQVAALAERIGGDMGGGAGMDAELCRERVLALQETNSMLGFRGCRVGIIYPEIVEMQTRAVMGAAVQAIRQDIPVKPELMIPLVCTDHEIDLITPTISMAVDSVLTAAMADTKGLSEEQKKRLNALRLTMGSMIEVPRACIRADRIAAAKHMEFISFGSNDLSQLVFGFSRDDSHRFMGTYLDKHLVARDPFESLDIVGVGGMIQMAVRRARRVNPNIKVGICGEHGGDPKSIKFFNHIGLNYVSCSPFRIPVAKLAAAQAHIEETAKQAKQHERRMLEDFDVLPMALLW